MNDKTGKPTGEFKFVDYVEYGPPGEADKKTTIARVERILKAMPPIENANNPTTKMDWEKRPRILNPITSHGKRAKNCRRMAFRLPHVISCGLKMWTCSSATASRQFRIWPNSPTAILQA